MSPLVALRSLVALQPTHALSDATITDARQLALSPPAPSTQAINATVMSSLRWGTLADPASVRIPSRPFPSTVPTPTPTTTPGVNAASQEKAPSDASSMAIDAGGEAEVAAAASVAAAAAPSPLVARQESPSTIDAGDEGPSVDELKMRVATLEHKYSKLKRKNTKLADEIDERDARLEKAEAEIRWMQGAFDPRDNDAKQTFNEFIARFVDEKTGDIKTNASLLARHVSRALAVKKQRDADYEHMYTSRDRIANALIELEALSHLIKACEQADAGKKQARADKLQAVMDSVAEAQRVRTEKAKEELRDAKRQRVSMPQLTGRSETNDTQQRGSSSFGSSPTFESISSPSRSVSSRTSPASERRPDSRKNKRKRNRLIDDEAVEDNEPEDDDDDEDDDMSPASSFKGSRMD